MPARELRPGRRGDGGDSDIEQRVGIGTQMQSRLAQLPAVVLEIDRLLAAQQAHDDVQALFQQQARPRLTEANHRAVGRQGPRAYAQHRPSARQMIEHHDAFGDPERVVIREADDAGAEPDVLCALRGEGH